jgi:NAD(P)-dependent dehydrogenase (short-subunit alcohol dehydrogenase family)
MKYNCHFTPATAVICHIISALYGHIHFIGTEVKAKDTTLIIGDKQDVRGKVAFITGASSGIGLITAKHLAAAGMKVVLTARRLEKLEAAVAEIKAAGGEALAVKMDVSKEADHITAFAEAEKVFGGVDAVFANAGMEGDMSKGGLLRFPFCCVSDIVFRCVVGLVEKDEWEFENLAKTNIVGVQLTAKHGVLAMQKRGGGTFAICSSAAGLLNK